MADLVGDLLDGEGDLLHDNLVDGDLDLHNHPSISVHDDCAGCANAQLEQQEHCWQRIQVTEGVRPRAA
eukprot:3924178-Rhodomonas_salina.4